MTIYNVLFTVAHVTAEMDNPLEDHEYIKVNVYGMEKGTTDRLCLIRSITTAIDLDSRATTPMVTTGARRAKLFTPLCPQRNEPFRPADRKAVARAYELLPLIKGDVRTWGIAYSYDHEDTLKTLHEADSLT